MKKQAAISAIGQDRPGIVAELSKALYEKGCNLEDSSMARLGGDFTVLLLVTLPDNLAFADLRKTMEEVARSLNLTLTAREIVKGASGPGGVPSLLHTLIVYGIDHPGIVYKVAHAASQLNVNITDLRTHVTSGEKGPLYSLLMEIEIPDANTVEAFKKTLEKLKQELNVEFTLKPVEADDL